MSDFRDVAAAGAELAVTIGIMEAALEQGEHSDEVKSNFEEKVDGLLENLRREQDEFTAFGEVYDRD